MCNGKSRCRCEGVKGSRVSGSSIVCVKRLSNSSVHASMQQDAETEAAKWNAVIVNFIIYTCVFPTVKCQNVLYHTNTISHLLSLKQVSLILKTLSKQTWHQGHSAAVKPHGCVKNNTLYSNFHNHNARVLQLQLSCVSLVRS